jgi:hypothetical protein
LEVFQGTGNAKVFGARGKVARISTSVTGGVFIVRNISSVFL